jgi:hypothetical protein
MQTKSFPLVVADLTNLPTCGYDYIRKRDDGARRGAPGGSTRERWAQDWNPPHANERRTFPPERSGEDES